MRERERERKRKKNPFSNTLISGNSSPVNNEVDFLKKESYVKLNE
jgi:hypothetical protein